MNIIIVINIIIIIIIIIILIMFRYIFYRLLRRRPADFCSRDNFRDTFWFSFLLAGLVALTNNLPD